MSMLPMLSWRNIWRNRRRSTLTILAVAFAMFLTVLSQGLSSGTWEYNIRSTLELFTGFLQVEADGYTDTPSLHKSVAFPGALDSILARVPSITGRAPRILADGLLSYRQHSTGAAIIGLDPRSESAVSRLADRVRTGRMLLPGKRDEAVAGVKLLEHLHAALGDTLVVLAQGYDGVLGNQKFRVVGAIKSGSPEFDATTILLDLGAAQELLAMEGKVSVIALGLHDFGDIAGVRRDLRAGLRSAGIEGLAVLTWDEVLPELKQSMEFDRANDWIFFCVLIVIVAFGILNTVLMSVTERFREFGISLAMGMSSWTAVRLVILETAWLALFGVTAGGIAGEALNIYLARHPIAITGQLAGFYEDYGFLPLLLSTPALEIPLTVAAVILGVAALACLYPVYRVSRLEPLKGMRFT